MLSHFIRLFSHISHISFEFLSSLTFHRLTAANDTMRLGATQQIENHHVRFLNGLSLSLWDCGGQKRFRETYFTSQRPQIFSQAEVLVYVIDVAANKWKARTGDDDGVWMVCG